MRYHLRAWNRVRIFRHSSSAELVLGEPREEVAIVGNSASSVPPAGQRLRLSHRPLSVDEVPHAQVLTRLLPTGSLSVTVGIAHLARTLLVECSSQ